MQKYENLVDLGRNFQTNIYLQTSASIQPRTGLSKFANNYPKLGKSWNKHRSAEKSTKKSADEDSDEEDDADTSEATDDAEATDQAEDADQTEETAEDSAAQGEQDP